MVKTSEYYLEMPQPTHGTTKEDRERRNSKNNFKVKRSSVSLSAKLERILRT